MGYETMIRKDGSHNILLVEGEDDLHFCRHMLRHHQIPEETIKITSKEGIDNLLKALEVQIMGSGNRRLGLIVDIDTNLMARWQAISTKLYQLGYITPDSPKPEGTIINQEGLPPVGIWLMPDNTTRGMIEDFAISLIPANDLLLPMAKASLDEVMNVERRFPENHKSKALIHTWLAWQEEVRTPLGLALAKSYLKASSSNAQNFMHWMAQLFDLS